MKTIHGNSNRDARSVTIFSDGDFTYEFVPDFEKLPAHLVGGAEFSDGCCDKEDNLYLFSRDEDHPIVKLDSQGNYVEDFGAGLFKWMHMLYVTPQNTLLCVDSPRHVVREVSMQGELLRDFGTLNTPSDSGFDPDVWKRMQRNGDMFATDIGFDASWAFVESLKTIQRAAPPFNKPTDAAVNSKGEFFFSDGYGNASIHKFSGDGELLKTWGGPGREPGKFVIPHAIEVDRMDRVWVADREGNSVHVFSGEGELLAHVSQGLYQPTKIWSDRDNVYVGERGGGITILSMEMDIVAQIGFFNSPIRPHGMCGNSRGDIFIFALHSFPDHKVMKLTRKR